MTHAACSGRSLLPESSVDAVDEILGGTAIVILTWNQREETRRCLQSLADAGYALSRVVLWDNGSVDGTEEAILSEFPDVVFHRHPSNLGVASGRNAGASLAMRRLSPSHLMFLDNDMVVTPGFLEALCEPFAADSRLAQTLAKIRFLAEPERLQSAGGIFVNFGRGIKRTIGNGEIDGGQHDLCRPCLPCGGATLVAASVLRELDGFDPIFDPYGTEDLDFSCRVRSAGYRALYIPEAVVYHDYQPKLEGKYIGQSGLATAAERWMILVERHATLPQKISFWISSAPSKLIRAIGREVIRGNAAALQGIPQGISNYINRLARMRKARQRTPDVGIETD